MRTIKGWGVGLMGALVGPAIAIAHANILDQALAGRQIFDHTPQAASRYVGDRLSCASCHLDSGKMAYAAPLWGAYPGYPRYQKKVGLVVNLRQRIQECFIFSERGHAPAAHGPIVGDIVAYAKWLANRHADRPHFIPPGAGYAVLPYKGAGSAALGRTEFAKHCSVCHGANGQGRLVRMLSLYAPPLWGPHSFAQGAGMGNPAMAARFIWANMPHGKHRVLAPAVARNIADFIDSHHRPAPQQNVQTIFHRY